jgi:hypothetical protein
MFVKNRHVVVFFIVHGLALGVPPYKGFLPDSKKINFLTLANNEESKVTHVDDSQFFGTNSRIFLAIKPLVESSKVDWADEGSISIFDTLEIKHKLFRILSNLRDDYPRLRCNTCVLWVNEKLEKKSNMNEQDKQSKRKSAGWSWDYSSEAGLFCQFHGTVHLPPTFFEQFFASKQKSTISISAYSANEENRVARKCIGIHPHCSICGMCHTNRRTHDRGHPGV